MTKRTRQIDRRSLLTGALTGAAAASMATLAGQAEAQPTTTGARAPRDGEVKAAQRGKYETVPLKQDFINVAAIQSRLLSIDTRDKARTLKRNMDRALRLIDLAQNSPE